MARGFAEDVRGLLRIVNEVADKLNARGKGASSIADGAKPG
jgi:hypothetical protein